MRLENDGDLHVDGNVVAYSTTTTSDPRLKENIKPVENALEKLEKLTGYTFDYKKDGKASAGVLSTEVEQVLPSAVQKTKYLYRQMMIRNMMLLSMINLLQY